MTWADADYGYKKKITIDHTKVAGDETNFPVLISVTDADLADTSNGGHVESSSGYDIVFYNDDEDTLLKHEIQSYDNTDGTLVFWVKVDSLSSTVDTDIYIYYGDSTPTIVDPSSTDTWDSDYLAVWHMDGTSDSTGNGYTLTEHNSIAAVASDIGKGYQFDGTGDYLTQTTLLSTFETAVSYETWVKNTARVTGDSILRSENNHSEDSLVLNIVDSSGFKLRTMGEANGGGGKYTNSTDEFTADVFHFCGLSWSAGNPVNGYLDKEKFSGADVPQIENGNDYDIIFGGQRGAGGYWEGFIDEARVSKKERTDNWMETDYNTMNDPASFMSWGAEEEEEGGVEHTHSASDTLTISDSLAALKVLHYSASDTLTVSDSLGAVMQFNVALADTLNINDSLAVAAAYNIALADTLAISDNLEAAATYAVALADTLAISDDLLAGTAFYVAVADTLGITDSLTVEYIIAAVKAIRKKRAIAGFKPARVSKVGRIGL